MDAFHQRQIHQLELDAERRHVLRQQMEYDRRRPRAALYASVSALAAPDTVQTAVRPLRGAKRGTERSRIKAWRLILPAVRAVYGGREWGQKQRENHKLRLPKGVIRLLQGFRMMSLSGKGRERESFDG